MQRNALSTTVAQCMYFTQFLLFSNYKNYTSTYLFLDSGGVNILYFLWENIRNDGKEFLLFVYDRVSSVSGGCPFIKIQYRTQYSTGCPTSYRTRHFFNPLTPNDPYRGRAAPLTSKRYILYIY